MEIFNALFFSFISMVLGGLFTNSKGENAVPRFVSLGLVVIVLGLQFYTEPVLLVAWLLAFYVIRIQSTRPLLDATKVGYNAWRKGIKRNLWLLPLIPFTSLWLVLLIPQVVIYYLAGIFERKVGLYDRATRISEGVTGFMFGILIS